MMLRILIDLMRTHDVSRDPGAKALPLINGSAKAAKEPSFERGLLRRTRLHSLLGELISDVSQLIVA